jgi:hypothetical protein
MMRVGKGSTRHVWYGLVEQRSPNAHGDWRQASKFFANQAKLLERLYCTSHKRATHTQEDDVQSNKRSLRKGAEVVMLILCGVRLVLRFSVFHIT